MAIGIEFGIDQPYVGAQLILYQLKPQPPKVVERDIHNACSIDSDTDYWTPTISNWMGGLNDYLVVVFISILALYTAAL